LALLSILTKFGQWDDLIISQLQAIFQLFLSYTPSGEFCQVGEFSMQATVIAVTVGEMFICSKLGQNLSEMEVRTFVRIQKVVWDQLLASKAEFIQK